MTVALALGGGAALGWAHIGVLRALEQAGIRVGAIAGTSMGALVGAAYAAGALDEVERIARTTRRRDMLGYLAPSFRRGALLGGRRVEREIVRHVGADARFDALPIPFAAVAADLLTGEEVRLTAGPLLSALSASMALPALFRPVRIGTHLLIDGGMVANLPLAAAHALAPALPLVGVDLFADYCGTIRRMMPDGRPRAVPAARAAFLLMMRAQGAATTAAHPTAALVTPLVGHLTTGSFHCGAELIDAGAAAVRAALPQIIAHITGIS